jgi:putative phosphoribosyl transferase
MVFGDRKEAGRHLAAELVKLDLHRPAVIALPRGGVPVGFEIAEALNAPLDVVLVRKIGAPGVPELAVGAIVDGGNIEKVIDEQIVATLDVPQAYLDEEIARQAREIERRRKAYLKGRPPADLRDSTAIVVDDGIATGATMRAALLGIRRRAPSRLILAVPVAPPVTIERLRPEADQIICLSMPEIFYAIGQFYRDFHQVSDEEVVALLERALHRRVVPDRPPNERHLSDAQSPPRSPTRSG